MSRKPYSLQPWERQAIIDAYRGGEKIDAICAEFHISSGYPTILAKRAGVALRNRLTSCANSSSVVSLGSAPS